MHYHNLATISIVGLALAAGACNRDAGESRDTTAREEPTPNVDRAAELQRERDDEISRLDKRVADIRTRLRRGEPEGHQRRSNRDRGPARRVEGRRDQRQDGGG